MDKRVPSMGTQVLAGVLTVVSSGLGLGEWLLLRTFGEHFLWLTGVSRWAWRWWEYVGFIGLGFIWLLFVYLVAYHYQRAGRQGKLGRQFGRVCLGQALLLLIPLGLLQLLRFS